MHQNGLNPLAAAIIVIIAAVGVGSAIFFYGSKNGRLKKRLFPWYMWSVGVFFVLFVVVTSKTWGTLFFVVPAAGLVVMLNLYMTRFCDTCGATVVSQLWLQRAKFCPRCGAPIEKAGVSGGPV